VPVSEVAPAPSLAPSRRIDSASRPSASASSMAARTISRRAANPSAAQMCDLPVPGGPTASTTSWRSIQPPRASSATRGALSEGTSEKSKSASSLTLGLVKVRRPVLAYPLPHVSRSCRPHNRPGHRSSTT
jgi:hypothetical protein